MKQQQDDICSKANSSEVVSLVCATSASAVQGLSERCPCLVFLATDRLSDMRPEPSLGFKQLARHP